MVGTGKAYQRACVSQERKSKYGCARGHRAQKGNTLLQVQVGKGEDPGMRVKLNEYSGGKGGTRRDA